MQPRTEHTLKDQQLRQPIHVTGLHRTHLDCKEKVALAGQALGREREHGAKTELARKFGVSRPTVYAARATATEALTKRFEDRACNTVWVAVDEAQIRRAVVALRIMAPNALRPIEDLIPILYKGVTISYGKVHKITAEAEQRAAQHNAASDLSKIKAGALDEMFSQGKPVLAGVDLDGGYLFSLALRDHRGAQDWAEVLKTGQQQGLDLKTVVKDAAQGIAAGVREVFPEAEQRDDCFHAHYEMGKVRRVLEQRAYAAIAKEEEARFKLERLRRTGTGKSRQTLVIRLSWAKRNCKSKLELHDDFEKAMHEAQEAMEWVDLEGGRLRTAQECQVAIESAAQKMRKLDDDRCKKVGQYIENRAPGLVMYIAALHQQLAALVEHYSLDLVVLACITWRLASELRLGRCRGKRTRSGDTKHLMGVLALLRTGIGDHGDALLSEVDRIIEGRHRASSAIEGFNAALRPFLYVHKRVSQGFLELFRAYYNLRTRRWGRHKGTSAHGCLTGDHVDDWLSVLGYLPSVALH